MSTKHFSEVIFVAIQQLISAGRLTGVTTLLALDGRPFLPPGDDQVDEVRQAWTPEGTSVQVNEYGAEMIRGVEDLRTKLAAFNDPVKQQLAKELPQWYGRLNTDKVLTDYQRFQLNSAHQQSYVISALLGAPLKKIADFVEVTPPFKAKDSGDPVWTVEGQRLDNLERAQVIPLKHVPNMRVCVQPWTPREIVDWAYEWAEREWKARTRAPDGVDFSPPRPA